MFHDVTGGAINTAHRAASVTHFQLHLLKSMIWHAASVKLLVAGFY